VSDAQRQILKILEKNGYRAMICRGFEEAIRAIDAYEGVEG
jgi:hypothetical protein